MSADFENLSGLKDELRKQLNQERISASELKWAIFCSVVRSYKKESLLKPFPSNFSHDGHKNFDELAKVVNRLPALRCLNLNKTSEKDMHLIAWVLRRKEFDLCPVSDAKNEFSKLKSLAGDSTTPPCPSFIFQVIYPQQSEERFRALREDRPLIHGYHGSQLPNFYSILHHGLISNLNKTSAFGEGTYLAKELNVSLNWSPLSVSGAVVSLGKRLSCVAFCEVIDHPTGVKHGISTPTVSPAVHNGKNSVPEKYVLVQNDALVRVKYLLVYAEKNIQRPKTILGSRVKHWMREHRFWIVLVGYLLVLMSVGVANSKDFHSYIKRFSHYWLTEYHHPAYDER